MSRLTGADAKGLMEAYNNVYAPQELTEEQVWEEVENWVNSLLEEGYDLSDYTWEEMYESYLQLDEADLSGKSVAALNRAQNPLKSPTKGKVDFSGRDVADLNRRQLSLPLADEYIKEATPFNRPTLAGAGGNKDLYNTRLDAYLQGARAVGNKTAPRPTLAGAGGNKGLYNTRLDAFISGAQAKRGAIARQSDTDGGPKGDVVVQAAKGGVPGSLNKTTGKWTASGSAPTTPKVSPSTPAKPTLGPTGKPLVGGIERRTPTRAEMGAAKAYRTPAATTGTLGAATAVASNPAAFGSTSTAPEVKATNTAAAKTTPTPVAPKPNLQQSIKASRGLPTVSSSYEYDAYDLVLEYLLSEGHADTVEEAHYVMIEMDAETIGSIIEERVDRDPRGRVSSGPMNVYRKPEGKPSQAHLDAVAAHRESEKKKSPEQKKKELDDYIQRQRKNK
jgi:hypothetical protein